ncbi:MAG: hypothetical protein ACLFNC_04260 [Halodesulfurarchaeum sp.]
MVEELEERVDGLITRTGERLETELDRTRAEKRALRRFAETVRTLELGNPTIASDGHAVRTAGSGGHAVRTVTAEKTGVIEKIRRAYESTVMAVPHYAEEYGDTYRESLEEEFSPEIALLLTRNQTVERRQQTILLEAVARSVRPRAEYIETLERERDSVHRHGTDVRQIASELSSLAEIIAAAKTFGDYDGIRSRLLRLGTSIDEIARTRQETVFDRRRDLSLPAEGPDLPRYLYSDLAYTYPILGTTVDLEERRSTLQARAERGLAETN